MKLLGTVRTFKLFLVGLALVHDIIKELQRNALIAHDPIAPQNFNSIYKIRRLIETAKKVKWKNVSPMSQAPILSALGEVLSFCKASVVEKPNPSTPRVFPSSVIAAADRAQQMIEQMERFRLLTGMIRGFADQHLGRKTMFDELNTGNKEKKSSALPPPQTAPALPTSKRVFISYAWSSPGHVERVTDLVGKLRGQGVEVIRDVEVVKPGQDLIAFMERAGSDPTIARVLVVCDASYARRADGRVGGVGIETQVIAPNVYSNPLQTKVIPLIYEKYDGLPCCPTFLRTRLHLDFSTPENVERNFPALLRAIFDESSEEGKKSGPE